MTHFDPDAAVRFDPIISETPFGRVSIETGMPSQVVYGEMLELRDMAFQASGVDVATFPVADPIDFVFGALHAWATDERGLIVSCGSLSPLQDKQAALHDLVIRPDLLELGIGDQVLGALEGAGYDVGAREVLVSTAPNNVAYYADQGYDRHPSFDQQGLVGMHKMLDHQPPMPAIALGEITF